MKIKKQHILVYLLILTISIISIYAWINILQVDKTNYIDGIYLNNAYGYHSDILVKVTIKNQRIYDVTILSHEEPEILANIVFEQLPGRMIKYNKAQVDIVSGATYTSKSLIEAVEKALEEAKHVDNTTNRRN